MSEKYAYEIKKGATITGGDEGHNIAGWGSAPYNETVIKRIPAAVGYKFVMESGKTVHAAVKSRFTVKD